MKDLNLAYITLPFPHKVDVALQKKWFSHGLIQLIKDVRPLSLLMLVKTLWISKDKKHTIFDKLLFHPTVYLTANNVNLQ